MQPLVKKTGTPLLRVMCCESYTAKSGAMLQGSCRCEPSGVFRPPALCLSPGKQPDLRARSHCRQRYVYASPSVSYACGRRCGLLPLCGSLSESRRDRAPASRSRADAGRAPQCMHACVMPAQRNLTSLFRRPQGGSLVAHLGRSWVRRRVQAEPAPRDTHAITLPHRSRRVSVTRAACDESPLFCVPRPGQTSMHLGQEVYHAASSGNFARLDELLSGSPPAPTTLSDWVRRPSRSPPWGRNIIFTSRTGGAADKSHALARVSEGAQDGRTAVHIAAENGFPDCVRLLIQAGGCPMPSLTTVRERRARLSSVMIRALLSPCAFACLRSPAGRSAARRSTSRPAVAAPSACACCSPPGRPSTHRTGRSGPPSTGPPGPDTRTVSPCCSPRGRAARRQTPTGGRRYISRAATDAWTASRRSYPRARTRTPGTTCVLCSRPPVSPFLSLPACAEAIPDQSRSSAATDRFLGPSKRGTTTTERQLAFALRGGSRPPGVRRGAAEGRGGPLRSEQRAYPLRRMHVVRCASVSRSLAPASH